MGFWRTRKPPALMMSQPAGLCASSVLIPRGAGGCALPCVTQSLGRASPLHPGCPAGGPHAHLPPWGGVWGGGLLLAGSPRGVWGATHTEFRCGSEQAIQSFLTILTAELSATSKKEFSYYSPTDLI